MTLRFYLAPQVEYVADGLPTRSPMHYQSFGRFWSAIDYGAYGERGGFLVMANVTDGQHRMLQSKPEITTLVEYGRLDDIIRDGELTTVQQALEKFDMPGEWVEAGQTWRQLIRTIANCFVLHRTAYRLSKRVVFKPGIKHGDRWGTLPNATRKNILDGAKKLGIDHHTMQDTDTLGGVIKGLVDQQNERPFKLAGWEI